MYEEVVHILHGLEDAVHGLLLRGFDIRPQEDMPTGRVDIVAHDQVWPQVTIEAMVEGMVWSSDGIGEKGRWTKRSQVL